jgi:hypothetical protein
MPILTITHMMYSKGIATVGVKCLFNYILHIFMKFLLFEMIQT